MKTIIKLSVVFGVILLLSCNPGTAQHSNPGFNDNQPPVKSSTKIQVALLLDASNSMDGLIEQAKSRLWNIVNTLTTLRFSEKTPDIEIALFMYGNDGIPARDNYIRELTPFTNDLDLISEKLFAINTNGGSEYCGAVIEQAIKKLDWGREQADMRLIYIAGNEPFTQGEVNYKEAVHDATEKDIYINTIYCGRYTEGIEGSWKDGADKGKGEYFNINPDARVVYIITPYDDEIQHCNDRLNRTYIFYGQGGSKRYKNQSQQDLNAASISSANVTERAVSKSKAVYNNSSWDLVDMIKDDASSLDKVDKKELPEEYSKLTTAELKKEIEKKSEERALIQKQINELATQRQNYINSQSKSTTSEDDLGKAINTSILNLARVKGYSSL